MNPLDWSGPQFLTLFIPLLLLAILAAGLLRWWLRRPGPRSHKSLVSVDPYEAALLRGREALVETAVSSLCHQGYFQMGRSRLVRTGKLPSTAPLIERSVSDAVEAGGLAKAELLRQAEPAVAQLRASLVRRGWLMDDTASELARWLPGLPLLAVLVLGMAKVSVGVDRGRPVGFLVTLCVVALLGFVVTARAPWRSRRGDAVLRELRREQAPFKQTVLGVTSLSTLTHRDLAMAVGLYGLGAVSVSEFGPLRDSLRESGFSSSNNSADAGGGGCGDGGGDGGGGGCGGCGGGCS